MNAPGLYVRLIFDFWGLFPFVQAVDLAQTVHPSMGWKGSKRGVD